MLPIEEAYMLKKYQSLGLSLVDCRLAFKSLKLYANLPTINMIDYSLLLSQLKLLRDDYPKNDTRFTSFYARLADSNSASVNSLQAITAVVALCNGHHEEKARILV